MDEDQKLPLVYVSEEQKFFKINFVNKNSEMGIELAITPPIPNRCDMR